MCESIFEVCKALSVFAILMMVGDAIPRSSVFLGFSVLSIVIAVFVTFSPLL
jgi:hypothetical protein